MANKNFRVRHGLDVDGNIAATDLTLSGNLTVNGTTTTLNTETLAVEDNIVVLNSNVTGTPTTDAGIEVERGDSTNSAVTWKESDDKWYQNRGGVETVIPVSTSELTEGTNQYFTQSRARQSVSVTDSGGDGSLAYDNSTGVFTYTGPSASEVRAHFSGGTGISITDGSVAVDFTEFDTDEITEGTTNKYYTDSRARQSISVTDAGGDGSLSYDNSTGVITYTGPSASEVRAHFSGGTGVTITDGVVAIGQSVGTGDTPTFAGVNAGNISVGVDTDNTITTTNTNGNLVLAANGSGAIVLSEVTRLQGEMQASTNLNYTFPAQTLNTVTDNNGYSAASSFPAGSLGYGANAGYTHYMGDTFAGNATTAAVQMRSANGNSVTGSTIPFTGLTSVAPSASTTSETMGTFNFNGYGTTGFGNDIGTANQGGGINALHSVQIQGAPAETFSDSTLTLTSASITAVASSFRAALGAPQVTGTKGQISFNATTPGVGNAIRVTGTLTGTATGIVSGNNYWIVASNGSTTATLSATPGGAPIDTTAGTLTGLTLTRCGVTFTLSGQTNVPFGRGALVTVANVTNVTNGTYPVFGTPSATSVALGIPHTVAPTLPGTQTFSCLTTYMAGGYRIRSYPLATPANQQNRVDLVNHTAAAATFRADTFTIAGGSYGTTGATRLTMTASEATLTPELTIANANTTRGGAGYASMLALTNQNAGATNINKYIRLNSTGALEVVNSAYSATIMSLTDAGDLSIPGRLSYDKVYGEFCNTNTMTAGAINTIYAMTYNTTNMASDVSIASNSRITIAKAGQFKIIMSLQTEMTTNSVGSLDFWLRKNGVDVANSATQVDLLKDQKAVIAMDWMVDAAANDYYEIVYAVDDTNLDMPAFAAQSSPYVRPAVPSVIVNVIPVGA